MSLTISMRTYLSISHLSAATLLSSRCGELEKRIVTEKLGPEYKREHGACVISSVILSAAFLEAVINEIFTDCADEHASPRVNNIPAKNLMARLWKLGIPKTAAYPILEKYEVALELNGLTSFDRGSNPYQDAKLLIELRNALVHFEPETIMGYSDDVYRDIHKFEKRLNGKFEENKLMAIGNPFYPDKVLGAGCANWSVRSALNFTDRFFSLLGIESTYHHVRDEYTKAPEKI